MDMKLLKIEKELTRLVNLDKLLISKRDLYLRKLDRAKSVPEKVKAKKLAKFDEEYTDMRLKVGLKRMKYFQEKLDIIGRPKSVKIAEENLDVFLDRL